MTTIKLRRGTAAEWTTANPILAAGEMGIETDTRKFKFGDGTTHWNTLAYASAEGGGGSNSGTTLTSTDGTTTYSKLALGDTLSVTDTSIKELNGLTQTGGTLNSELEFTGGSDASLKMTEKYSLSTADSWEFQIKYKHNGGGSSPTVFGYASGSDFKTPALILEDGSLKLYLSSDGYSWNLNDTNSGLVPVAGTIYYFKIGFTGSQYYIKYNTTGWSDEFTTQWTLNSTTKVYCSDYFMLMNLSLNSNYYNTGTMYLQDTALVINEAEVWRGVNTIPGLITLNASLDNILEPNLFKTPLANSIFDITNISDLPIGETIINTSCTLTSNNDPHFAIIKDNSRFWYVGLNPGTSNLFRVGFDKTTFVDLYKTYKVKIILNKTSDTEIYAKGILYNLDNTTVLIESGFEDVSSGTSFEIRDYGTLNSNWISLAYDNSTLKVNDSGQLYANLDTKQDILVDGNGTKVVDNKVDINQGNAGIQGLNLYQNNGTITKNNDLSITFNNGACGYIFLENKGVNNDYEIILHQSYLGTHGTEGDCNIVSLRCLPQALVPTPGDGAQGECWFDTFNSPFRIVVVSSDGNLQQRTVGNINYVKYVIKGTNLTVSYSSTGEAYTELYTIAISSTYVINVCVANSPWQNDIGGKWTKTTLYSDSYILDKTTNTYLMKQGISDEGVAVATSNKYGLVLPDNSTIVSNNGVLSSITPNNMVTTDTEQTITGAKTFDKIVLPSDSAKGIYGGGKPILYQATTTTNTYLDVTNAKISNLNVNFGCTTGSNSTGGRYQFHTGTGNKLNGLKHDKTNNKIVVGDTAVPLDIEATKVLFNTPTLARKVDDSTEATIIDSSNVSTYATSLPFPSNRYIDLELGASGTSYTAPADGWVQFRALSNSDSWQYMNITGDILKVQVISMSNGENWFIYLPVKRGENFTVSYSFGGDKQLLFIYAQGSESEAS